MKFQYKNVFSGIGNRILECWRQHSFDERMLPSIASNILSDGHLESLDPKLLVAEFIQQSAFDSMQTMVAFSDLALNVFRHPRFFIEVLYWTTGTTTIHEHSFSGAFYVWHGQSLNVEYTFQEQKCLNSRFKIGDLKIRKVERLRKGTIKPIRSGSNLIHAVFHLECPSVTVVIRTYQNPDSLPQLEYRHPHIAIDATQIDPAVVKCIQAINIGSQCPHWRNDETISYFFKNASIDDVYRVYRSLDLSGFPEVLGEEIKNEIFSKKYGNKILRSIEREKIVRHIVGLRSKVTDEGLRMFLALLANIQGKNEILNFIEREYSTSTPELVVAEWILSLSKKHIIDPRIGQLDFCDIVATIKSFEGENPAREMFLNEIILEEFMR